MIKENKRTPKIGELYYMWFEGAGSEQSGWRPGIIFQNNVGNRHSPNVIVLPITSVLKKTTMPTHVLIKAEGTGLKYESMVLCENPVCMSKEKIGKYIGKLSAVSMEEIAEAYLIATSAIAFLDQEKLIKTWSQTKLLNAS